MAGISELLRSQHAPLVVAALIVCLVLFAWYPTEQNGAGNSADSDYHPMRQVPHSPAPIVDVSANHALPGASASAFAQLSPSPSVSASELKAPQNPTVVVQQQLPRVWCCATTPNVPIWEPVNGQTFTDGELPELVQALRTKGTLSDSSKYAADMGANDGVGPSEKLFTELGYPGVLIEGDPVHLSSLKSKYPRDDVKKVIAYITPKSAAQLLKHAGAPLDMHYFKIDLDADDFATLVAVLEAGYRPKVIQAEVTYEFPHPYAFALYPLSKYGYLSHYGFQAGSFTMLHAILSAREYHLISVGGTKDAIFAHRSVMAGMMELDLPTAVQKFYISYGSQYGPNPSNTKQLENEQHPYSFALGKYKPSQWFSQAYKQYDHPGMLHSMKTYMDAACLRRASNVHVTTADASTCPFEYILSDNPVEAEREFTAKVKKHLESP